jgi:hypothetical protein
MGIWDDPWLVAATTATGDGCGRFRTCLPPPPVTLPVGVRFRCVSGGVNEVETYRINWEEWRTFVGTARPVTDVMRRIGDGRMALLEGSGGLIGTCVLRPRGNAEWILETLRATHGNGGLLMRSVCSWLYAHGGPFILLFTWELSLPALAVAWWRGWLRAAAAIEYGWMWVGEGECGFCPSDGGAGASVLWQDASGWAIVSDSGDHDGWGHVLGWTGVIDWPAVAKKGGWRRMWMRAATQPPEWRWSGEFVVVGALNAREAISTTWVTAEIA